MSTARLLLLPLLVASMAGQGRAYMAYPPSLLATTTTRIAAPHSAHSASFVSCGRRQPQVARRLGVVGAFLLGGLRATAEGEGGMEETEQKITIVGAVVERQGKFLMVERLKRSRGYFEFPGGKVEEGETDQSALVRELREELQVEGNVISQDPVAVGRDGPVQLKCYRAEISGDPQVPRDTLSVRWVGLDELASLAVPPADQAVVRSLLGMAPASPPAATQTTYFANKKPWDDGYTPSVQPS